ncbi:uncharacterized protein GIQ15_06579 [Arthroderma uncinatum]|uniref:uncharacterized protein n=1 Tax=Arthroderma uncinatum TaxID=74035 RepID=UPI00144AEE7B|nr:uncharacterized protein GIQ15_06579 [Arthroderma uncinatum]KAF3479603.1 hypothetical protein GIQ15_06579 [Arthroderma uncinatum]
MAALNEAQPGDSSLSREWLLQFIRAQQHTTAHIDPREELAPLAIVDPALTAILEKGPAVRPPMPSDPYYGRKDHTAIREHRATILKEKWALRYLPGPIDEVTEQDRKIPVRDGSEITIRIYKPVTEKKGGSPLIVMYHEGGWAMGDLSDEEVNCRLFSRDLGAVCVNVEYRLAPEHPFPTWINDSWDALQWCAKHASELGADPSQGFVIGGGSAGGNIAAVLAHIARDEKLSPPLTGQYLGVPAIMCFLPPSHIPAQYRPEYLSHPFVTPCQDPILRMFSFGPLVTPITRIILGLLPLKLLASIFSMAGMSGDMSSPLFVPFHYGKLERGHKDLPPVYLQVCGLDPLRDEGLIYERVLREEGGVKTKVDIYKGLGHYFWTNFPDLEMSKTFVEDTVKAVKLMRTFKRTLTAATFVQSVLVHGGFVSGHHFIFFMPKIFRILPQLWRLTTPFLLTGGGLGFFLDLYFLYSYASDIEVNSPRFSGPGDFVTYVIFVAIVILLTAGFYLQAYVFLGALSLAFLTTLSQDNAGKKMSFIFFKIPAEYMPFASLLATLVLSGQYAAITQACGIIAAHLYEFLTRIYPNFGGGVNYIRTPLFIQKLFRSSGFVKAHGGYRMYRPPADQTPSTGESSGSWFSGSGGSWGGRGAGRRLGSG